MVSGRDSDITYFDLAARQYGIVGKENVKDRTIVGRQFGGDCKTGSSRKLRPGAYRVPGSSTRLETRPDGCSGMGWGELSNLAPGRCQG